jgi:prepilin-type N-terminal cleavage/methylation domain-containing protein
MNRNNYLNRPVNTGINSREYNVKNRGFTMVEVTVVISLIALLAAGTVLILSNTKEKSDDTLSTQNIHQIKSELEIYSVQHSGSLPEGQDPNKCVRDMNGPDWTDRLRKMDSIQNRDFCVRYYREDNANMAEIWAPLVTNTDKGYNRKIGAVVGAGDINDIKSLCLNSLMYPMFNTQGNGSLEACNGDKPFDLVLDVDSGAPAK